MNDKTVADRILSFLSELKLPLPPPKDIEVMNPLTEPETSQVVEQFYHSFYNDQKKRWMIIGINPGRFGGGITGIPFTDPLRLETACNISNPWPKKQELSSVYIYDVIDAFGGVKKFYERFYITAVSPLGFTKSGRNLNYYDDMALMAGIGGFVKDCILRQLEFGIERNVAFCLGDGKNYKFLKALNDEMRYFLEIIPLSHPRFIMQYRLKKKSDYISHYLDQFEKYTFPPE